MALEAGYLPIRRVKSYLFYELTDQVQLFTGFEWNNDAYLLADRVITDNFLFSYDKRLSIGARWEAPAYHAGRTGRLHLRSALFQRPDLQR